MIGRGFISELVIAFLVIALSVLLFNPFGWWMSNQTLMTANVALVVIFVVFATLVWRERAHDEREHLHRQLSSRVAYVAGTAVLVIGVVAEAFEHRVDLWLVVTLCVMVLAKIGGLIYSQIKH